jgi:lysophospholipase L1-like esterase
VARIVLAAFGVVVALAALELELRLASARGGGSLDATVGRPAPAPGAELQLGDMIRPVANDRIVYELRPDLRGRFIGAEVATNSLGMRSEERALAKASGVFRIVGIGDSVMFGWGVDAKETYLARLEKDLGGRFPQRRFEVWNLGVPGYNSVQEVSALREKIDALGPDLLVIGWVGNDMDLPNFLATPPPVWSLDRSFLFEFVARRWAISGAPSTPDDGLYEVPLDEATRRHKLAPDALPARYRPLVGWDNMTAAYRELHAMAHERRIPAVVVFIGGPRFFEELCAKEGFVVVEAQHAFLGYEAVHHVDRHVALTLSPTDPHPNAIGHGLIEEALIGRLLAVHALDRETSPTL